MHRASHTDRIREAMLDWVILDNQTLQAPQHPALVHVIRTAIETNFEPGGQIFYSTALTKKRDAAKKTLKALLKGTSPAATTDIWTSSSGVSNVVGFAVHSIVSSRSCSVEKMSGVG